jgi:hypothetical protein
MINMSLSHLSIHAAIAISRRKPVILDSIVNRLTVAVALIIFID